MKGIYPLRNSLPSSAASRLNSHNGTDLLTILRNFFGMNDLPIWSPFRKREKKKRKMLPQTCVPKNSF
jgi:hypothetical protein